MTPTGSSARGSDTGCLVLLECPPSLHVGIDYRIWKIGDRFKGICEIPPGLHYFYWDTASDSSASYGSRVGEFLQIRSSEVVAKRWDPKTELFSDVSLEDRVRISDAVVEGQFHSNLGPYERKWLKNWTELSSHVTLKTITRIQPKQKYIRAAPQPTSAADHKSSPPEFYADHAVEALPTTTGCGGLPIKSDETVNDFEVELNFAQVPKLSTSRGKQGADLTQMALDRSILFDELISIQFEGEEMEVLAEVEVSFICFLLGQRWDAFESWKRMLQLLCSCEAAVCQRPKFFSELLRTLYAQLKQTPDDLFVDTLIKDNFLADCFLRLHDTCSSETTPNVLKTRVQYLEDLMKDKFKLNVEELRQMTDDPPVVIETDDKCVSL